MNEIIVSLIALLLLASPLIALALVILLIVKARKKRAGAAGRPVTSAKKPASSYTDMDHHIQEIFPRLNQAAGDFLGLLSDKDFKGDLVQAAEMAGLKLLRNSGVDLRKHTPGHILLGFIPDETYNQMQHFMYSWYMSNEIPVESLGDVKLPKEDMEYIPGIILLEPAFDAVCRKHQLQPADAPYAAALAALKLVAAGSQVQLIDLKTGQYMAYFHLLSASKTVPQTLLAA